MAARKKRGSSASTRKTKASGASAGGRRGKRPRKGAASTRGGSASARKSASRTKTSARKTKAPPPQPDIQEESGATVYSGRSDVPHPGVESTGDRVNAEDHSSPRSRLHDGSESVVRTSEESAVVDDRTGKTAGTTETDGPGQPLRSSDERAGTSGPAGAYFEDGGDRADERPRP